MPIYSPNFKSLSGCFEVKLVHLGYSWRSHNCQFYSHTPILSNMDTLRHPLSLNKLTINVNNSNYIQDFTFIVRHLCVKFFLQLWSKFSYLTENVDDHSVIDIIC